MDHPDPGPSRVAGKKRSNEALDEDSDLLPFPGRVVNGELETVYRSLSGKSRKDLVEWCGEFHLSRQGNMKALTARLREFSGDKGKWESLLPGARNMHRNPRVGLSKRTSKPAKSTLRRAALMGTLPATQKAAVHHLLPTVRSIDRRTAEEKASVFDWAERFMKTHPYDPPSSPARQPAPLQDPRSSVLAHPDTSNDITVIKDRVLALSHNLPGSLLSPAAGYPTPPKSVIPLVSPTSSPPLAATVHSLSLADGSTVKFTASDIPMPPGVSFVDNLDDLIAMWDDASPKWERRSLTILAGRPVPLKLWPAVYHSSPKMWDSLKRRWSDWKLFADHWSTFSKDFQDGALCVDGVKLAYSAALKHLRAQRQLKDKQMAAAARMEYDADFDKVFSYMKRGKVHVMSGDGAIARHFAKLKGLAIGT